MRDPRIGREGAWQAGCVPESRLVMTSAGLVEITQVNGERPPVLFFPGGHCSARCDCGWSIYTQSGHGVISFSRPGYGATRVGALGSKEFAPLVREVCQRLNVGPVAAAVGVSFGGMQAVHVAADTAEVRRLILHSCAPSALPYPDSRTEAIGGPIVFSPVLQGIVWYLIRRMVHSERGLRRMMAQLSRLPIDEWWNQMSSADKAEARALFDGMRSGSGFVNDVVRLAAARTCAGRRHWCECPARRS